MRFIGLLYIFFFTPDSLHSQIVFTKAFTKKLYDLGLVSTHEDASWYVVDACHEDGPPFDLCLISEKDSAELKYILLEETKNQKIVFPEMHFSSRVAGMAINDETSWIRTKSFTDRDIEQTYKADWAAEVSFIPKKTLSDKKYAKLFALYKDGYGMAYVVLFYNWEYEGFNRHLHSLSFTK